MSIVRVVHNRENPFVQLNKKALWDENLSLAAVGLWARILSRPDDWKVSAIELAKSCNINKCTVYKLLNELIENGYAYRHDKGKGQRGRFQGTEYYIFEFKTSDEEIQKMFPQMEFSDTVASDLVDATLLISTNISSNLEEKEKEYTKGRSAPRPPSAPSPSPEAQALCEFFLSQIKKRFPKNGSKITPLWLKQMEKLLRERGEEAIREAILWTEGQRYFHYAILSPKSLTDKFDEIQAKIIGKALEERTDINRQYALKLKAEYPQELKNMIFTASYVKNIASGDSISFNLPEQTFQDAFLSLFGGSRT